MAHATWRTPKELFIPMAVELASSAQLSCRQSSSRKVTSLVTAARHAEFRGKKPTKYRRSPRIRAIRKNASLFLAARYSEVTCHFRSLFHIFYAFKFSHGHALLLCPAVWGTDSNTPTGESRLHLPWSRHVHMDKPPTWHERVVFPPTCLSHLIRRSLVGSSFLRRIRKAASCHRHCAEESEDGG